MIGYALPVAVLAGLLVGADLTFGTLWAGVALSACALPFLPFGELRAKPLFAQVSDAVGRRARRRKTSGWKRNRFY